MSWTRTALGLVLAAAGTAALPALLGATAGQPDLVARVPAAYELNAAGPSPRAPSTSAEVYLGPDRNRIREDRLHGVASPGLDLITWRADYGDAWHREVTWPSMVGPFAEEGADICGYEVQLGAALFDTSAAGRGLKDAVARQLANVFPYRRHLDEYDITIAFPELASSDFTIKFDHDRAWIHVEAILVDGTFFSVRFPVRLVSRNGTPAVERIGDIRPEDLRYGGASFNAIEQQASDRGAAGGAIFGLLLGPAGVLLGAAIGAEEGARKAQEEIPGQASRLATQKIDEALDKLAFGMEQLRRPWSPDPNRPRDAVRLRLGGAPRVSPQGIELPLCASVTISSPMVDLDIPGPVQWGAPAPEPDKEVRGSPRIGLTMNADAIGQVLHYVWQAGKLHDLGRSSVVLNGLTEEVRVAAFHFTGLEAQLPPTIVPSASTSDTLSFALGNVDAGRIGSRRVLAHGMLGLRMHQQGDAIQLSAEIADLRVNCREPVPHGALLTPCLGDILPLARQAAAKPILHTLPGGDVLAKLPRLSFQGMVLHTSDLRVRTSGSPVQVGLSVQGRIEAP